ncbi:MAG: four-carbon acid sugar kinase family protein [Pseudomonadales bacterium]|jgi:uncharacterized protein YgbK (DUF1537 family)|nr:four-carbon acid sugar kinase family protein [Pseudomonadales bacterium]MDP7358078.1 four-carbon acid sugar kinase family protein [Pseudomonadales bacterium]HJN51224.1 four-carbon acid sugar kinase family protein [Pseudomonadales bacterium]|tara:strand:+ start:23645 stop:25042 length:1398 start_codon:yes stop_codon:yes gene_type:complete
MKIEQLLAAWPPEKRIPDAREQIGNMLTFERSKIVVLDDDPMGTQSIHDVDVYMSWQEAALQEALEAESPLFFLSTNSRSLPESEAYGLNLMLSRRLKRCADRAGRKLLIASRSDSTLRGHFPAEIQAIEQGLAEEIDAIIIALAFFAGGRFTIDDTQWVEEKGGLVPSHETEFADDPLFRYTSAHLPSWIEEKSGGNISRDDVLSISLSDIRAGGPECVERLLRGTRNRQPVVVNAACASDLEIFVLGLMQAESEGKRFLYRCAAPFIKVRGGIADRPLLNSSELGVKGAPGVVVVGSYVEKSTRQLEQLLQCDGTMGIEVPIGDLFDAGSRRAVIDSIALKADAALRENMSPVIFTERRTIELEAAEFLQAGAEIMDALCHVLSALQQRPAFILAKGGNTSHQVAGKVLKIDRAHVLGQLVEGVPVWHVSESGNPLSTLFVLFPGNQGTESTLADVYKLLVPH